MTESGTEGLHRWRAVVDALRRAFVDALLAGADDDAERIVREAIEAGIPEAVIDDDVIAPALRTVGELWERGTITVADEHLATQIAARVVALQREAFRAARRRGDARVLLLAPQGEHHVIGLQMAASILRHAGYGTVMLGADVPLRDVPQAVRRHAPAVVGLTATLATSTERVRHAIAAVASAAPRAGVLAGGPAAPAELGALPGVAVCRHVADAVDATDALLHRATLN